MFCIRANPQFLSVPGGGKAKFRQNQLVKEETQSRINLCFCTSGSLAVPEGHLTDPAGRRWWCYCQILHGHFCHIVVRAGTGQKRSVLARPHLDEWLHVGLSAISFEWLFPETIVFSVPKSICEISRPDGPLIISIITQDGGKKSTAACSFYQLTDWQEFNFLGETEAKNPKKPIKVISVQIANQW